jgi:hypothetical protein
MRASDERPSLILQAARPVRPRTRAPCRNWHLAPRPALGLRTSNWLPGLHRAGPSTPLDERPVQLSKGMVAHSNSFVKNRWRLGPCKTRAVRWGSIGTHDRPAAGTGGPHPPRGAGRQGLRASSRNHLPFPHPRTASPWLRARHGPRCKTRLVRRTSVVRCTLGGEALEARRELLSQYLSVSLSGPGVLWQDR